MKVAFFLESLSGGGAQRATVDLANLLAESGLSVDLVLHSAEGPYIPEVSNEVNLVELTNTALLKNADHKTVKNRVAAKIEVVKGLKRYLGESTPATLISALNDNNIVAWLSWLGNGRRVKFVPSQRARFSHQMGQSVGIHGLAWKLMLPIVFRSSDAVIAVSDGVKQDLTRFAGVMEEKIHVVYNPFDVQNILSLASQKIMINEDFDPVTNRVVLAAGRLVPSKRFDDVLRSFSKVSTAMPEVKLILLGRGPELSRLKRLAQILGIADKVLFAGFIPNPFPLLKHSQAFISASESEGFPNVLVQSLILGTPVISSDCNFGPKEIIGNSRLGLLVKVGDIQGFSSALLKVLEVNRLSKSDREFDMRFSGDRTLSQINLLLEFLSRGGNSN